jgi:hypothetical protein
MRRLALAGLALGLLAGEPARADAPQRVLALVTSPEAQVQGMAFVLLNQMRAQGLTVEVMLCGAAGDLARRDAPAGAALRGPNASPAQMLRGLVAGGVRTEVCALYLPNAGLGPDALIEGVRPATPPEMARRMLAEHTRVLPF